MTTQLHLAQRIVDGRAHSDRDLAIVRSAELAIEMAHEDARRTRTRRRLFTR